MDYPHEAGNDGKTYMRHCPVYPGNPRYVSAQQKGRGETARALVSFQRSLSARAQINPADIDGTSGFRRIALSVEATTHFLCLGTKKRTVDTAG